MCQKLRVLMMLVVAALLVVMLVGCETTKGFGRDLKATGDAIEDAAD